MRFLVIYEFQLNSDHGDSMMNLLVYKLIRISNNKNKNESVNYHVETCVWESIFFEWIKQYVYVYVYIHKSIID